MNRSAVFLTLGAAATLGVTIFLAQGCGGTAESSASTGGSGGSGGTTTTTTESGGSGGTTMSTTSMEDLCIPFCDHLTEIACNILPDCLNDCHNHLNAPADCVPEADALLACWEANAQDFVCTMVQVLPPAVCQPQESAFNSCVANQGIDTSCICSVGVGVGDGVNTCSRKTTCAAIEYVQTCQKLNEGEPWTCSCFANSGLLGTCSEADAAQHCSNMYGCCVPLFCAANGQ